MKLDLPMRRSGIVNANNLAQQYHSRVRQPLSTHSLSQDDFITPPFDPFNAAPVQQQPMRSAPPVQSIPYQHSYTQSIPPVQTAPPTQTVLPVQKAHPQPSPDTVMLQKGQKVNIAAKNGASLNSITLGVGWNIKNTLCELDMSAFMLDANSRIIGDDWFVFYGQPVSPDGSMRFSVNENGSGDDETIAIDLQRINPSVQRIAFVVTINEALQKRLNFSMVQDVYVRIINPVDHTEIVRFLLTDYYNNVTAMVVGELYRYKGVWKLNAVGDGVAKDLAGLCAMYGVEVEG